MKGIGSYTAGAISSFVYHQQKPAVDGNVFRVVTRILEDSDDIMKASTRTKIERMLEQVIPAEAPGDFNTRMNVRWTIRSRKRRKSEESRKERF